MRSLRAHIITNLNERTFDFDVESINEKELFHLLRNEFEWLSLEKDEWLQTAYITDEQGLTVMKEDENGEFHLC